MSSVSSPLLTSRLSVAVGSMSLATSLDSPCGFTPSPGHCLGASYHHLSPGQLQHRHLENKGIRRTSCPGRPGCTPYTQQGFSSNVDSQALDTTESMRCLLSCRYGAQQSWGLILNHVLLASAIPNYYPFSPFKITLSLHSWRFGLFLCVCPSPIKLDANGGT